MQLFDEMWHRSCERFGCRAFELFDGIGGGEQALQAGVIICNALIRACDKDPTTRLAAFDEMRQQALQPIVITGDEPVHSMSHRIANRV